MSWSNCSRTGPKPAQRNHAGRGTLDPLARQRDGPKGSACPPRVVRSASKLTLSGAKKRRLMQWSGPTSFRSDQPPATEIRPVVFVCARYSATSRRPELFHVAPSTRV